MKEIRNRYGYPEHIDDRAEEAKKILGRLQAQSTGVSCCLIAIMILLLVIIWRQGQIKGYMDACENHWQEIVAADRVFMEGE